MNGVWAWPSNARKAHYFVGGRSLCRRWMFFGSQPDQPQTMSDQPLPEDCIKCWEAAQKEDS